MVIFQIWCPQAGHDPQTQLHERQNGKAALSKLSTFLYSSDTFINEPNCSELVESLGKDERIQTTSLQNPHMVRITGGYDMKNKECKVDVLSQQKLI